MAARSTNITIVNNTTLDLILESASVIDGIWSPGSYPQSPIAAGTKGSWQSESDGVMTGTEGNVTYHFQIPAGPVYINWDNPYVGNNGYSIITPAGYTLQQTGGDGDNATVTFTLSPNPGKNVQ